MEAFWVVLGLCLLPLLVFLLMIWVKEVKVKEVKEMATYLKENQAGQDEMKTMKKMSS